MPSGPRMSQSCVSLPRTTPKHLLCLLADLMDPFTACSYEPGDENPQSHTSTNEEVRLFVLMLVPSTNRRRDPVWEARGRLHLDPVLWRFTSQTVFPRWCHTRALVQSPSLHVVCPCCYWGDFNEPFEDSFENLICVSPHSRRCSVLSLSCRNEHDSVSIRTCGNQRRRHTVDQRFTSYNHT